MFSWVPEKGKESQNKKRLRGGGQKTMVSKKVIGVAIAGVILAAIIIFLYFSTAQAESLIAISDVQLIDGEQRILATVLVDSRDAKLWTLPTEIPLASGKTLRSQVKGSIRFIPGQAVCEYDLQRRTVSTMVFGISLPLSREYWVAINSIPNAPFVVTAERNGVAYGFTTMDVFTEQDHTFKTDFGDVTISRLGLLQTGYDCPSANDLALTYDADGRWYVVKESSLRNKIDNASDFCIVADLQSLNACINNLVRRTVPRADIQACSELYCPIGYLSSQVPININEKGKFIYNNEGTGAALVTVTFDKEFVDGIVIDPITPQPKVTIETPAFSINKKSTKTIVASIENLSTEDDAAFQIFATTQQGNASVSPQTIPNFTVSKGQTRGANFSVLGLNAGGDEVCIEAISSSQFGGRISDRDCLTINVNEQEQPQLCGNGVCDSLFYGENYANCPEDCPPPLGNEICDNGIDDDGDGLIDNEDPDCKIDPQIECLSRPPYPPFILGWVWTPPQLLGAIAGRCDAIYNWAIIIGIAVAIGLAIFGFFAYMRLRKT